jgi:pimeloyl-ACP methyl ester carboxylesterase
MIIKDTIIKRLSTILLLVLVSVPWSSVSASAKYRVAISSDSERIAYSVYGSGRSRKPTLIFIHGWSCDSRYWENQVTVFSFLKQYQVIAIDLAGHGHSSSRRLDYTMLSFANDIKAVIEKENLKQAILIGHSMGGGVVVEAARLMPETVVAIIGIDTLHDVTKKMSKAQLDSMLEPLEADFPKAVHELCWGMFPNGAEEELINWIKEDMASAPKKVGISAFKNYQGQYVNGEAPAFFKSLSIPVVSINGEVNSTNSDEHSKLVKSYKLFEYPILGHFPMLEKPEEFDKFLTQALEYIKITKE